MSGKAFFGSVSLSNGKARVAGDSLAPVSVSVTLIEAAKTVSPTGRTGTRAHDGLVAGFAAAAHVPVATRVAEALFTLPTRPTATQTITAGIQFTTDLTTAASDVIYMPYRANGEGNNYILGGTGQQSSLSLTNNATLWSEGNNGGASGFFVNEGNVVDNKGLVVAIATQGSATGGYGTWVRNFINNGQIYVAANGDVTSPFGRTAGTAVGISIRQGLGTVENNGLIAVRSVAWEAVGISVQYTPPIINRGTIQAEGVSAVGISVADPGIGQSRVQIENSGLIEARTTSNIYSYGIGANYNSSLVLVNSGTIRADIAIYINSDPSDSGYESASDELVTNTATGRIEGAIYLSLGRDELVNQGTIVGVVLMDVHADLVTNSGTIEGYVDLGFHDDRYEGAGGVVDGIIDGYWGNDVINGGNSADYAIGGRGNDTMDGRGGNDLLMGGFGNDVLTGGAGNDGLFGEFGNDRIVTQGGDFVEGGTGDDRIETGDLSFELIDGGEGFDTFVLAPGNRIFDLSAALDEDALRGIERIDLLAGQGLVVRPGDIADLSGVNRLFVGGAASNQVYLVGSWTDAGTQVIGGTSYHAFTSGGSTLLVGGGAATSIAATPPAGATGLDPFAGGELAPLPGEDSGVPDTSPISEMSGMVLWGNETVAEDEVWVLDPSGGYFSVVAASGYVLTNHGTIFGHSTTGHAAGVWGQIHGAVGGEVVNTGDIGALADSADKGAYAVIGQVRVDNSGTISAKGGVYAKAVEVRVSDRPGMQHFANTGLISAEARTGMAIAVELDRLNSAERLNARNDGTIRAVVGSAAEIIGSVAVSIGGLLGGFTNTGLIEAIYNGTGPIKSRGISLAGTLGSDEYQNPFTINNSGTIRAQVAIEVVLTVTSYGPTKLFNTGVIEGDILLGGTLLANDLVDNTDGRIVGNVRMGSGNDTYIGIRGELVGTVRGGIGDDRYVVDDQWTAIVEEAGEGTDTVEARTGYYLFDNFENLTLGAGAGDIYGVGNGLANAILGNEGSNLLIAGAGDDVVRGGAGVDSLFGQDGADQLFGDAGIDYLVGGIGNDVLDGGTDADALYGEDGDDTLIGGSDFKTDILVGGAGNDVLRGDSGMADYDLMDGGSGNDAYYVDTGDDLTFEAVGGGIDTVYANVGGANNGVYLYANVENLVLLNTTAFGVGNELANVMTGSASANWLLGGAGNDTLNGKGGNDVLFGEGGADTFVFERGTGGDVIGDFLSGTDKIDLRAFGFANFQAVTSAMREVNGTTAIDLGNGDMIVINGVANATLQAGDFLLAPAKTAPDLAGDVVEDTGPALLDHAVARLWHGAANVASDDLSGQSHWIAGTVYDAADGWLLL